MWKWQDYSKVDLYLREITVNKYLLSNTGLMSASQIPEFGNKMMALTLAYKMQQSNLRRVTHLLREKAEKSRSSLGEWLIHTHKAS